MIELSHLGALEQWKQSKYAQQINFNTSQLGRVIAVMVSSGDWHTLREIESLIHSQFPDRDTQAAISARLREVSPSRHGLVKQSKMEMVNKKQVWRYRLTPTVPVRQVAQKIGVAA
ncbi:TPA: hypothetical protein ACMDTO_000124 [Vibrio cholerae]|uniref:hypothetical protein n=1 Tax=Vibrio TaxID=662 RepID=UPI0000EF9A88|nr:MULTISPECIES: hypothetical protein [Vibrio]EJL6757163.1 hypothetical protein [Vibrio cholerae]EKF9624981.1 hypothetical protein [Vibrio cholerae]EKF9647551.1 hypothetical protein [Vibrio cholerae]EKF9648858.1 hypothetical protein [Vibrio cholerae]EKF9829431.1 hypothetical protein [Vibrio cholerae]